MTRIGGIDVDRVYTADEIGVMILDGRIKNVVLHGYVAQANADGTCRFVPYYESGIARQRNIPIGSTAPVKGRKFEMLEDVQAELAKDLPVIRKRTPEERLDSLAKRIEKDAYVFGIDGQGEAIKEKAAEHLFGAEKEVVIKKRQVTLAANRKERRRQERLERLERQGHIK